MQTIDSNDILFDDLSVIKSLQGAGQSNDDPAMINDCINNPYIPEAAMILSDCKFRLSHYDFDTAKSARIAT